MLFACLIALIAGACATSTYTPQSPPSDPTEYYQPGGISLITGKRLFPDPTNGLGKANDPSIRVTDIQLTNSYTVLSMTFGSQERYEGSSEISIQPEVHLITRDGQRKYNFIKAEGIPVAPNRLTVDAGDQTVFRLYFERLDKGVELFGMYECEDSEGSTCWNIVGMTIQNPADSVSVK